MEKHSEKEQKIIEKFIVENCWDGIHYDFSIEKMDLIYKELKTVGILKDKKYLNKIFEDLIKIYESNPDIKK